MEGLKDMSKYNRETICSWVNECENYGIHCTHCKWNADNKLGNFLSLKGEDQKTLKYLTE